MLFPWTGEFWSYREGGLSSTSRRRDIAITCLRVIDRAMRRNWCLWLVRAHVQTTRLSRYYFPRPKKKAKRAFRDQRSPRFPAVHSNKTWQSEETCEHALPRVFRRILERNAFAPYRNVLTSLHGSDRKLMFASPVIEGIV